MTVKEPILFFWEVYDELKKHKHYERADYLREMMKKMGVTIFTDKDGVNKLKIKK